MPAEPESNRPFPLQSSGCRGHEAASLVSIFSCAYFILASCGAVFPATREHDLSRISSAVTDTTA